MKKIQFLFLFLSGIIGRYIQKIVGFEHHLTSRSFLPSLLFKYRFILIFLLIVIAGVLITVRYKNFWEQKPTLSEGIIGLYTWADLPPSVTNLLSGSLVSLDKQDRPEPSLAKSWTVNKDATIYTFKLKDNLYWNDGTKIKASDLKFNLTDVDVSFPDDKTIQFKLPDSFAVFPSLLTAPIFKGDSLIGTGQYTASYQELSRGWATKLILSPLKPNLPKVTIRFYPDDKTAVTAFDLGEVDSVLGISNTDRFKNFPNTGVKKTIDYNKLVAIFYNTQDKVLADKNFRRALGYAAPKIEGEALAKTSIPPSSWAYNDQARTYLNDDPDAKASLAKVANGKNSTIILTTTPDLADLGNKVIQAWKLVGINCQLQVESGLPQNFQALLTTQDISSDPDQYALWHSTQTDTNLSKYKSDRVDKDLEDGRKIADPKVRQGKYFDFQKVLLDDAPATFFYFPTFNIVYRLKFENLLNQVFPLQSGV